MRERARAIARERKNESEGERESSTRVVSEHQISRSEERVHARAHEPQVAASNNAVKQQLSVASSKAVVK